MKRQIIGGVLFFIWTLAIIYGTYNNTVTSAHVVGRNGNIYQIQYDNTGDIFEYADVN